MTRRGEVPSSRCMLRAVAAKYRVSVKDVVEASSPNLSGATHLGCCLKSARANWCSGALRISPSPSVLLLEKASTGNVMTRCCVDPSCLTGLRWLPHLTGSQHI